MIARPSLRALTASALRRTGKIAVERPAAALWTLLALSCALFAVAVAATTAASVERWAAERPGPTASMVVYLGEGVDASRAQRLVAELRTLEGVEAAALVSAEESARRLVTSLGTDAALLEGVELASLPASVEVTLAPGVRDVVAMSPTVRALRAVPGVAEVVVEDAQEDRIASALGSARKVAWTGAALFAGLALIVVLAAIRVRLDRSPRELAVARLLGASSAFTIVPTALAGALSGAAAAVVAAIALRIGLHLEGDAMTQQLASSLGSIELVVPTGIHLVVFVGLGGFLGLLGGGLAGASRVAR